MNIKSVTIIVLCLTQMTFVIANPIVIENENNKYIVSNSEKGEPRLFVIGSNNQQKNISNRLKNNKKK